MCPYSGSDTLSMITPSSSMFCSPPSRPAINFSCSVIFTWILWERRRGRKGGGGRAGGREEGSKDGRREEGGREGGRERGRRIISLPQNTCKQLIFMHMCIHMLTTHCGTHSHTHTHTHTHTLLTHTHTSHTHLLFYKGKSTITRLTIWYMYNVENGPYANVRGTFKYVQMNILGLTHLGKDRQVPLFCILHLYFLSSLKHARKHEHTSHLACCTCGVALATTVGCRGPVALVTSAQTHKHRVT